MRHYEASLSSRHDTNDGEFRAQLLLGYAQKGEQIAFMTSMMEEDTEIEQTLTKALDLLPEFLSIPIGEEEIPAQHIDECLHLLQTIDVETLAAQSQSEQLFSKISQMRQIIERLHTQMDEREGYRRSFEADNEHDSWIAVNRHNITLMGESIHCVSNTATNCTLPS
mmetsp:Transcript_60509/g.96070  ORF Transcript_60509/g.96070 Transcript_60509/m.96070 type:complete len:167 (+) Transcript_60509:115-615(+)